MNNLLCLPSFFSQECISLTILYLSILCIACALCIRIAILLTKGTKWKRGKPTGSVLRPCKMGWHPIVYTLLSTPAFPWARCARASDLQGRSTLSLFSTIEVEEKKVKELLLAFALICQTLVDIIQSKEIWLHFLSKQTKVSR